ncbi:uncharacterized protein LOC129964196 [Argiope bruennichi]|uniref:uncharacterized protein LOC129964196 n=1 Tax=Argiope bruennichi TaxID=94029 RepID=UPI002494C193|nr:uncharacterized protein LOC129964196 [Argiope bruennichi]XP_055934893.1 uncharacterized protein LOC129964196 [Argiope bruennichi]
MSILLQLLSLLVCLQTVWPYPIQDDEGSLLENYGLRLAKRPFYPYKDAILSPFGFLDTARVTQGQRKKAVDSTFIRFGRSSSSESGNGRTMENHPSSLLLEDSPEVHQPDSSPELSDLPKVGLPQRFLLNHNGCRVTSTQELRKALLSDPNCIRAFQKAKKENVNDTFIRFGKREAPSEKEFESVNSNEAR